MGKFLKGSENSLERKYLFLKVHDEMSRKSFRSILSSLSYSINIFKFTFTFYLSCNLRIVNL